MLSQSSCGVVSRVRLVALLALVGLMACGGLYAQSSSVSLPQVTSGTWATAGQMSQARTGAASAVLHDGSLLVAGGTDASGNVLATVEIYGATGAFQVAPPMQVARTGHTATWLLSGYVLVAGGTTTGGAIVSSAEIYDPVAKQWTLLPNMSNARAGHTATALPNGDVLMAGGQNASGPLASLEVFHAATRQFSPARNPLATARKAQAATALNDGRVLVVGGTDANGATLGSTEIYDPKSGGVTAGPLLTTPRASATATTLLDGTVLIAAGSYPEGAIANNGIAELQTAEIFDPVAGAITPLALKLMNARSGQLAVLLPHNNNVLLDGGVFAGADLAQAELYAPWTQAFSATGSMGAARSQAVGGALSPLAEGLFLVAGGSDLASAELYGFPTVKTDQGDYAPGTPVNITGSGWQPGETVSLYLRESPLVDTPPVISVSADGSGNISNSTFAPNHNDVGVHFYLTAAGAQSQAQAQTMFSDGLPPFISIDCEPDPVALNSPTSCAVSLVGNGTCVPADGTVITWSATAGSLSAPTCTLSGLGCAVNFTPTGTTESVSATYPDTTGCLSQTATVQPGLQAALSVICTEVPYDGNPHSCTGVATGAGGAAVSGTWSFSPASATNAGSYPVTGTFISSDPNYAGGTASGVLTIDPATPALTVLCPVVNYTGYAHTCWGTATGVGGAAVNGWFSLFSPASETNAGTYPVTGTFSSYDPNYASGGTAVGTLTINPLPPTLALTCPKVQYDGNPHSCTGGTAIGVGAGYEIVNGSWSFSPASETNAGCYPEIGTFATSDPNFVSGGTSGGTLVITKATPTVTVICPAVNYDGKPHSCTATATGIGGAAVSGSFTFSPGSETAVGSYPETATFTSSDSNYTNGSGSGTLVINAAPGNVTATFSTTAVTFPGSIMVAQPSAAQYVLITNTGTALLQVSGVTLGGANPGDFAVTNQAGTCTTGATLVNHADCNLRVIFTPTAIGTRSAILYIYDNLPGSPQQVTLSGTAISGAQLTLSATTLSFPTTPVGSTAATQYLTLKSTGYTNVIVSSVNLSDPSDFVLSDQAGTCTSAPSTTLVPGADCNIRVQFHPKTTGPISATVTIVDNTPSSPHIVTLNGAGE